MNRMKCCLSYLLLFFARLAWQPDVNGITSMLKPIIIQLLLECLSCFDISAQVVEITSFSCGSAQLSGASLLSVKTSSLTGSLASPSHVTYQTDKYERFS